ncbi:MAG: DUF3047 domain-containing protein [Gammaproteobacteria bacterium]|nr:DUF3047 domain-containing protein [Gammaproteobacteria bacterium]
MMGIKIFPRFISVLFTAAIALFVNVSSAEQATEAISLQAENFEHIQFKKIPANKYSYKKGVLTIEVDDAASFLMLPFDTLKMIKKVSFDLRSEGEPLLENVQHELQQSGDDAVFKLGILLRSGDDSISLFVPSWLKQVRQQLKFPSEEMIYLVAGAKHAPGERWANPYNERITMISVESLDDASGWHKSSYIFNRSQEAVALWLMADGDNTHASFSVSVKNIVLEID